jgi:hypothetical protein
MPEFTPFLQSRLKVKRAEKHIHEFDTEVRAFLKTDFYTLAIKDEPETGYQIVHFEVKPLPEETGVMIGDAIHNLRSALDLMVNQMYFEKTGKRSKHVKFPVYPSKEQFEGGIKGGDVRDTGEKFLAFLRDTAQPYPGGGDVFPILHRLDLTDKHELLIPHVAVSGFNGLAVRDDRFNCFVAPVYAEGGKFVISGFKGRKLEILGHPSRPAFNVLFPKDSPAPNSYVLPTLAWFRDVVLDVINRCEAL